MKELYVKGIVQDYDKSINSINKYLFSENERLNTIIDELEEKRKYDLCFISHLKKDKKQLQQRIDKAIEYIKNSIDNTGWLEIGNEDVKELLEILGDKEND